MKIYKNLSIKGAVLDKVQLGEYIEKVSDEHVLQSSSSKETYPVPKMIENFNYISKTYELLNRHLKLGIKIHSAGEWILDNFYIIEETVRNIEKELTIKKYKKFVGIASGRYKGFARIYVLASEIVGFTDAKINEEILSFAIEKYQTRKTLSMEEIWNIGIFLQIAIIQNIKDICEKIYSSQIQKYKVESICERLVENKKKNELIFSKKLKDNKVFSFNDLRYPFIEYMLYKLRRSGKKGNIYLNALEEQVKMMGTTIGDIVRKEHFYIATIKISVGNCITSIKTINRINFQEIFEERNKTEEILRKDPAGEFEKMTYESKIYYRNKIKEISEKTNISEIYITERILELAEKYKFSTDLKDKKKSHVGYYLIDKGYSQLIRNLTGKKYNKLSNNKKSRIYLSLSFLIPIIFDFILIYLFKLNNLFSILIFILLLVPLSEIYIKIVNYILSKIVKSKMIPKINYENGIPKEKATFVVIPTIINNKEKIDELIRKLEVYYLANKSENLYFGILGDCTSSDKKNEVIDTEIVKHGMKKIKKLNEKYENKNIFHFLYRKRIWNQSEGMYLGWERKRGLLNEFNDYLIRKNDNNFIANSLKSTDFNEEIKYIITLDCDTNLILGTAASMIGAMSHILNRPVVENKTVVDGYGIMQPRVGIDLESSRKTLFSKIFSGIAGIDFYTNAISDIYQDCFGEGIFTGKGIYDLKIYDEVLNGEIPENKVLSHDLLEGNYLRCGLLTDVTVLDNYPSRYSAYLNRQHRWIRGDWQIVSWIGRKLLIKNSKKDNKINQLAKFKIYDNLRRSLLPIANIILFFISITTKNLLLLYITLASILISTILEIVNFIVFKESTVKGVIYADKKFSPEYCGIRGSMLRGGIEFAFLPTTAYTSLNAIIKTLYRLIKKKKLLEWMTSEEAEKMNKNGIEDYCKLMFMNIILGIILFGFLNPFAEVIGTLWILSPFIAWYISLEKKKKINNLSKQSKEYIYNIGKKTWSYFEEYMNEKNNFFPPDNFQEDRREKIVKRTSSTNIGLGLLAIISAYDLKYITLDKAINLLKKSIDKIEELNKWYGHLYNWYNLSTLKPLSPRYISTVDSGNFVGYLYVVKEFLNENIGTGAKSIHILENKVDKLIKNTDFSKLYSKKNRLFSIGYNIEEDKLTDSYYDFLASEARQSSIVAIAKKDVPVKHWNNLSRTLTSIKGYKGLISWSGTAFEYLMPNINIKNYEGSLLDESCKFLIMSQKEYSKSHQIPWGISESAYNIKDLNSNYQYKAFGIPWLGLKRGLEDEIVVSPYSTFLSMGYEEEEAIKNLKELEKLGMTGKYGFYESIDYTGNRVKKGKKFGIVKTYMAHHQGLILLSINNMLNNNILQKRFLNNPEIEAVSVLLQERMPDNVVLTGEKKEKIQKIRYTNDMTDKEIIYNTPENKFKRINVISNEDYTVLIDTNGQGYSKYKDILINRYREDSDYFQGIGFFIKNIRDKKIWSTFGHNTEKADRYKIKFMQYQDEIQRTDGNIETNLKVTITQDSPTEIRRLEIKNTGTREEILEITSFIESILSEKMQDDAHPLFNNMFLRFEYIKEKEILIVTRKNRDNNKQQIYMGIKLYTQDEIIGESEFEIDKERFIGRKNIDIPEMIKNSKTFSNTVKTIIDPIIAMKKTIKVEAGKKIILDLIISLSDNKEEIIKTIERLENNEEIEREYDLAKARSEEEIKYLGINGDKIEVYQKLLGHLLFRSNFNRKQHQYDEFKIGDLWKFGISGDNPILVVEIENIEDLYVIDEVLESLEFFKTKNMNIDLCIINKEENRYDQILKDGIIESIKNRQLEYMINEKIFIINDRETDEKDICQIKDKANLILKAKDGGLKVNIEELEEKVEFNNSKVIPKNIEQQEDNSNLIEMENLKFYNGFGGFSADGNEYIIEVVNDNETPAPWSNVLCNGEFGTLVTENFGGFIWDENSRLKRINIWRNDPVLDIPSEAIFLKDCDNENIWSVGSKIASSSKYYVIHGLGYTIFKQRYDDILQEATVFVPKDKSVKVTKLSLRNLSNTDKKIKLYYYTNLILGEDYNRTKGKIFINKFVNSVHCRNIYKEEFEKNVYISINKNISRFTFDKDDFNLVSKNGIYSDKWNNNKNQNCIVIEVEVDLKAFSTENIIINLGTSPKDKVLEIEDVDNELEKIKKYWYSLVKKVEIKTPSEEMNIILNSWSVYQTISCRILGKSGYYQSGGAVGFRDQLQDSLGMKFINPEYMKNQIIKASEHQFKEGDVLHWWHEDTQRGIRTRFSDDLLWLPYVVIEYIDFTGDYSILDKEVSYVEGEKLKDNEDERYDYYKQSEEKETIYIHCIRAIEKSLKFGKNGFPKIGSGDWNDGFSTVGNKGDGESIWLGFFIYDILNRFDNILKYKNSDLYMERYHAIKNDLKKKLNSTGWDGLWFRRAITDDGDYLGTMENTECKIDSISQSWSVISGAGDNDKKFIAMDSIKNYLIDKENGIIRLLTPAFKNGKLEPGYIKMYPEGVRENGGQYTHAAIWAIMAFALLGFGDEAVELFDMINPIDHSKTKEQALKYKIEPYVLPGDIYSNKDMPGRGGWSWYTGSSSWYYKVGIENILGLKISNGKLSITPCIPKQWKEYEIRYKFKNTIYNIKVKNPDGKNYGIENIKIDGKELENQEILLVDDEKNHEIEIKM